MCSPIPSRIRRERTLEEPASALKSFLVRVYWIKIDGEYIYQAAKAETLDAQDSDDAIGPDDSEDLW